MKVNITGKGSVQGVSGILPVYNRDLSEKEILRLLNFSRIRLFDSASKTLITKKNVKAFFAKVNEAPDVTSAENISDTVVSIEKEAETISGEVVLPPDEQAVDITDDIKTENNVVDIETTGDYPTEETTTTTNDDIVPDEDVVTETTNVIDKADTTSSDAATNKESKNNYSKNKKNKNK